MTLIIQMNRAELLEEREKMIEKIVIVEIERQKYLNKCQRKIKKMNAGARQRNGKNVNVDLLSEVDYIAYREKRIGYNKTVEKFADEMLSSRTEYDNCRFGFEHRITSIDSAIVERKIRMEKKKDIERRWSDIENDLNDYVNLEEGSAEKVFGYHTAMENVKKLGEVKLEVEEWNVENRRLKSFKPVHSYNGIVLHMCDA